MSSLTVIRAGMLTTVQDLGRWGQQSSGVPVAGPMDGYSHRLANRLVGNPENAAALEITLVGPELEARGDAVCAVAGAEFVVEVNGELIATRGSFSIPDGGTLRFGARGAGARATVAVRGGIDVPATFGSRATSVVCRMGPFGGRALAAGDEVAIGAAARAPTPAGTPALLRLPDGGTRVRAVMGPQDGMFTERAVAALLGSRFIVTAQSNRMGYRLAGAMLERRDATEMLSEATPFGSLQVSTSGQPILLMADRQTTGGYPKIATVITADLPLAGQLAPGDWIEFEACTPMQAVEALRRQEAALSGAVQ
jgi:antagonist of KipI